MMTNEQTDRELLDAVFARLLGRPATHAELRAHAAELAAERLGVDLERLRGWDRDGRVPRLFRQAVVDLLEELA